MRISIGHVSRYVYSEPTKYSILALRLTPPSFQGQRVIDWRIVAPGIDGARPFQDGFGNTVHLTSHTEEHSELLIVAKGIVDTEDRAGVVRGIADPAPRRVYQRQTAKTKANDDIRVLSRSAGPTVDISGMHKLMHGSARGHHFRNRGDERAHHRRRGIKGRQGRLPGPCTRLHFRGAFARSRGTLRQRLSVHRRTVGREPRMGGSLATGPRLGRLRPRQPDLSHRSLRAARNGLDAAFAAPIRGTRRGGADEELDVIVEVQQQASQQQ